MLRNDAAAYRCDCAGCEQEDAAPSAETQKLLSALPPEQQKLVADLIPATISLGGLQRVLQMLLAERISIRDMPTILEAVQEACANNAKSVGTIVAHVRTRLSRQISDSMIGAGGYVAVPHDVGELLLCVREIDARRPAEASVDDGFDVFGDFRAHFGVFAHVSQQNYLIYTLRHCSLRSRGLGIGD